MRELEVGRVRREEFIGYTRRIDAVDRTLADEAGAGMDIARMMTVGGPEIANGVVL